MGSKLNPGPYDCYRAALLDETQFILNARDPDMPETIRFWITLRQARIARGEKPQSDMEMLHEAAAAATDAAAWREENRMVTIPQQIAGVDVDPFIGPRWHFETPPSIDEMDIGRLNEIGRLNDQVRRLTGTVAALQADLAEHERLTAQEITMGRRIAELEAHLRTALQRASVAESALAMAPGERPIINTSKTADAKRPDEIHSMLSWVEGQTIAQALVDYIIACPVDAVIPIYACDIRHAIESARGEHLLDAPATADIPAALRRLIDAGKGALGSVDDYNTEHQTYLGGPCMFELGRSIAVAEAAMAGVPGVPLNLLESDHIHDLIVAAGFGQSDERLMYFIAARADDAPVHVQTGDLKQALANAYGRGKADSRAEIVSAVCSTLGVDRGDDDELFESRRDKITRELASEAAEASARFRREPGPETISVPRDMLLQALRDDDSAAPHIPAPEDEPQVWPSDFRPGRFEELYGTEEYRRRGHRDPRRELLHEPVGFFDPIPADAGTTTLNGSTAEQIVDWLNELPVSTGEVHITVGQDRHAQELNAVGWQFTGWSNAQTRAAIFTRTPARWTTVDLMARDARYVASLSEGARAKVKAAIICLGCEDLPHLAANPQRWPRFAVALEAIEAWHEKVLEAEAAEPPPCGAGGMGRGLEP